MCCEHEQHNPCIEKISNKNSSSDLFHKAAEPNHAESFYATRLNQMHKNEYILATLT